MVFSFFLYFLNEQPTRLGSDSNLSSLNCGSNVGLIFCGAIWISHACVPHSSQSDLDSSPPCSSVHKALVSCLGSDLCLCNLRDEPRSWHTTLWDCSLDFLPLCLTFSGSLGLTFLILWPESWGFHFSTLLGISHYVSGPSIKRRKEKAKEICLTLVGPQLLWSDNGFPPS